MEKGGDVLNEKRFQGPLCSMLPALESFVKDAIVTQRPVPVTLFREKTVVNYPNAALRELLMNANMHRDYQSNMPIRLYQFDDHIEIMNAGGLYGEARPENFPTVNDYRNPVVAEAMKGMKYVNMFNQGVKRVQDILRGNGNKEAEFDVSKLTVFCVNVFSNEDEIKIKKDVPQGVLQGVPQDKDLDTWIENCVKQNPMVTTKELAMLSGRSSKTIKRHISKLDRIRYIGSGYSGHWEIINKTHTES